MSEMSNFLENELYDHLLRNLAYTAPSTLYVALLTTDPTDANTGTEVSGNAYARQTIAFGVPSDGVGSNSGAVTFPTASPATWGNVTHFGIYDAVSGGNLLLHTPLTAAKQVDNGDTFKINIGDLTVTFA